MSTKSDNDFTIQNELLAKIKLVLDTLNDIDEILDRTPQEQSKADSLRSDYLHLYEGYDLSESSMVEISKKLHDVCVVRRNWNNVFQIGQTWRNNLQKIVWTNQRPFLYKCVEQTVKNLNCEYKDRVLTEDDKKQLLATQNATQTETQTETQKTTRKKHLSLAQRKEIIDKIRNGLKPQTCAKEYNVCVNTINNILSKSDKYE